MSHKPIASLLAISAGLTMVLAGCKGDSSGGGMQSTITLAEAGRKVDEYAEAARLALAVKFTNPDKNYDFPCSNADGSPAKNRRDASVSYQLEGAPLAKTFEALRTWWPSAGFTVVEDDPQRKFLTAENKANGFRMGLQGNDLGEVYLTVSSPCVWRNGTPEPDK